MFFRGDKKILGGTKIKLSEPTKVMGMNGLKNYFLENPLALDELKNAVSAKRLHKGFPDPAKAKGTETEILKVYRDVRDSLKEFVIYFVEKELDIYVKKEATF